MDGQWGDLVAALALLASLGIGWRTRRVVMNLSGLGKPGSELSDSELEDAREELDDSTSTLGYIVDEPLDLVEGEINRRKSIGTWTLIALLVFICMFGAYISLA